MRIELQMALDSKDSDIEQLRNLLQSLSVQSLDSTSVNSGPEFDTDDAYTGESSAARTTSPQHYPKTLKYIMSKCFFFGTFFYPFHV